MTSNENSNAALAQAIEREVKRIIPRYGFSRETRVSLLSESENKVFLVEDPEGSESFVARVNSGRLGYHRPPSIASELMWLMALREDTDILVPRVLTAGDGSLVQTLDGPDLDKPRHVAVYSFLSGSEPSEDDLPAGFERLGEISARMNRHAKRWQAPAAFKRHVWTPEVILDDQLNWGHWRDGVEVDGEALALLSRLDRTLRGRLATLPREREQFGLIHADLRLANLLVEGERTAIIDFDDCGDGWYLFDLATALSFLEERPEVPELIASWLTGYRRIEPLTAEMEAAIPAFIMLRRLQLIGWVGYQYDHLEFAREIGPGFTADSCRLAEDYLSRAER